MSTSAHNVAGTNSVLEVEVWMEVWMEVWVEVWVEVVVEDGSGGGW